MRVPSSQVKFIQKYLKKYPRMCKPKLTEIYTVKCMVYISIAMLFPVSPQLCTSIYQV